MKIFPLRPLSNYDRVSDFMLIIEKPNCIVPEKLSQKVSCKSEINHQQCMCVTDKIAQKYGLAISEIVSGLRRLYGKKGSIN